MIVADTDVLIDFLAGRGSADRVAVELERGMATTTITRFELLSGARTDRERRAVTALLDALLTLPFDSDAADRAAEIRRGLEGHGRAIGMADSMIAGIVITRRASLLTGNRRHFERVEALDLAL